MRTLRISHPAFFGVHTEATIRFYSELLGMRIVLRQPNLDDASMEHVFFHVGEDNFIAYFLPYDETGAPDKYQRMRTGYGVMNHLALPLRPRLDHDPDQVASEDLARVLRSERQLSWGRRSARCANPWHDSPAVRGSPWRWPGP